MNYKALSSLVLLTTLFATATAEEQRLERRSGDLTPALLKLREMVKSFRNLLHRGGLSGGVRPADPPRRPRYPPRDPPRRPRYPPHERERRNRHDDDEEDDEPLERHPRRRNLVRRAAPGKKSTFKRTHGGKSRGKSHGKHGKSHGKSHGKTAAKSNKRPHH